MYIHILHTQIVMLREQDKVAQRDDQLRMKDIKLHELHTQLELAQKDARNTQGERDRLSSALEQYRADHLQQLEPRPAATSAEIHSPG